MRSGSRIEFEGSVRCENEFAENKHLVNAGTVSGCVDDGCQKYEDIWFGLDLICKFSGY
jgi:hypothetical protein